VAAARTQPPTDGIESFFFNRTTHQRIVVDWRDNRPGDKQFHWEQRGVPFRFEVGPRDVAQSVFVLKRRLDREKANVNIGEVSAQWLNERLEAVHAAMLEKARKFRDENTRTAATYDEMKKILAEQGGFVRVFFNQDKAKEAKIKEETKATVRCIPFQQSGRKGKDIITGEETETEVLFAQAY
jgi:prolyl-tRNA synthetase